MNKITSTLAGLALVAAASIAPAMAQAGGNFTNLGVPFVFFDNGAIATAALPATFNPFAGADEMGILSLTLTGGNGSANTGQQFFSGANLIFAPNTISALTPVITDTTFVNGALVNFVPGGPLAGQAELVSVGKSTLGNSFVLFPGAPVPEASTTVSFGALLALGGLAVVLRRKGVKNAA